MKSLLALSGEVEPDIIFPMMDLSIESEALGLPVVLPEDESPSVEEHPVASSADLEKLKSFNLESGRIRVFLEITSSGTPEEIARTTESLLDATAAFGNFIPSTGCDLPPETPLENMIAFSKAIRQYTQ